MERIFDFQKNTLLVFFFFLITLILLLITNFTFALNQLSDNINHYKSYEAKKYNIQVLKDIDFIQIIEALPSDVLIEREEEGLHYFYFGETRKRKPSVVKNKKGGYDRLPKAIVGKDFLIERDKDNTGLLELKTVSGEKKTFQILGEIESNFLDPKSTTYYLDLESYLELQKEHNPNYLSGLYIIDGNSRGLFKLAEEGTIYLDEINMEGIRIPVADNFRNTATGNLLAVFLFLLLFLKVANETNSWLITYSKQLSIRRILGATKKSIVLRVITNYVLAVLVGALLAVFLYGVLYFIVSAFIDNSVINLYISHIRFEPLLLSLSLSILIGFLILIVLLKIKLLEVISQAIK